MDDEFIQLKKVTKTFGKNKVLDEIDFSIPEGKITGIIGASGEGKSTILKLIASFYKPTSGEILYFRRSVDEDSYNVKKSFGFAIEDGSFYGDLTVYENFYHFGRLYKVDGETLKRRIKGVIHFLGLDSASDVPAKNLSLGMKKRVDLGCAMIHKPSVLILDEPTADLDPLLRGHMLKIIKKINSHGTTIIFTTQILGEIDVLCDKVAILYNEKIVENSALDVILKKYDCKNMNEVFKKVFSSRDRKAYQESNEAKSLSILKKHEEALKSKAMEKNDFIQELSDGVNQKDKEVPEEKENVNLKEKAEPEEVKKEESAEEKKDGS